MDIVLIILLLISIFAWTWLYSMTRHRAEQQKKQLRQAKSRNSELISFLNRYAESIAHSNDTNDWMQQVANFVAQALEAESVWIYASEENAYKCVAFSGADLKPGGAAQTRRLIELLCQESISQNDVSGIFGQLISPKSTLKEDFEAKYGQGPIKTLLSVPLRIEREEVGLICAINRSSEIKYFSNDDKILLESISSQVALGITFVQLYEELGEQQRLAQELKLARTIQDSLIPEKAPKHANYMMSANCMSAREVSGDFYDFIKISEDLLLVVVADASGKGVPACMLMALCRSVLRTNAMRYKEDLEGLMHAINRSLYEDTDNGQFITLACLLIDKHDHVVEYSRAGHTELLIKSDEGNVEVIAPDGPAIGLLPPELNLNYDTFSFSWQPGMSLMLFTDGITEALNDERKEYGLKNLIDSWTKVDDIPEKAIEGINEKLEAFTGQQSQEDDQTILILHRPAS